MGVVFFEARFKTGFNSGENIQGWIQDFPRGWFKFWSKTMTLLSRFSREHLDQFASKSSEQSVLHVTTYWLHLPSQQLKS